MTTATKPKRQMRQVAGIVRPEDWYTRDGLMEQCGIGEDQLAEARRNGFLIGRRVGLLMRWSGREVIEYFESFPLGNWRDRK